MARKPMFAVSPDRQVITDYLEKHLGDFEAVHTWDELTRLIGRDIRQCRHILNGAIREMASHGAAYTVIRGVGIKLAQNKDIHDKAHSATRGMMRKSGRALREMALVKYEDLDNDNKIRHNTLAAQLGAMRLLTQKRGQKLIEAAVTGSDGRLGTGKTLRLFVNENGETKEEE